MPKIGLLDFHLDINKRLQVIANLDATICIKKKTVSEEIWKKFDDWRKISFYHTFSLVKNWVDQRQSKSSFYKRDHKLFLICLSLSHF